MTERASDLLSGLADRLSSDARDSGEVVADSVRTLEPDLLKMQKEGTVDELIRTSVNFLEILFRSLRADAGVPWQHYYTLAREASRRYAEKGIPLESVMEGLAVFRRSVMARVTEELAGSEYADEVLLLAQSRLGDVVEHLNSSFIRGYLDYTEARHRARQTELHGLYHIASALGRSLDVSEIAEVGLRETLKVLRLQAGAVWVREGAHLILAKTLGLQPGEEEEFESTGRSTRVKVVEFTSGPAESRVDRVTGEWSAIRAELRTKGVLLGAMTVATRLPRTFESSDLEFVAAVADQIEVALDRARQHTREARTDYLTGLANRRHFYDQLNDTIEVCRRQGTSFALLSIDLDRFKELNDTLGHYAGDQLLTQIGPRMQAVVGDAAVARLGGDEFGLIVRDESAAAATAERIHRALARPFELDELTVSVQASVGIAVFPNDAQSTDGLLQRADIAMYQAKGERSRHSFYAPAADHSSRERLGLVGDLKRAVEQGGLVVHYQPQVDLRTNTVSGVEALVRWQHPERGLLGADAFVAIAEQSGVMRELTASVLEQALGQHRAWLDEGRELNLAVNVSATNLLDAAFLGDLKDRMERWRTPPGTLRLEITESVLIAEGSRVQRVIESLGDLGVLLSLDDFGTGYSPLSYLRELPVTEIKIDRSFVAAMMGDRDTATIVAAVIGLARRLGIEVVAEGIETAGQLEMLRSFESPFAQGYLFSRPLPAQAVGRWLKEDALQHIAEEVLAAGRLADVGGAPLQVAEQLEGRRPAGALVWPGPVRRRRDIPIA